MALFLGSGVIVITLLGILLLFSLKYKEAKILLSFFFRIVGISIISIMIYTFTFLFRWPNSTDILICAILNIFGLWFCSRLFFVFREFISLPIILSYVILIIIDFIIFTIQVIVDINSLLFLSAFLSLVIAINLHFLTLSVLIKFEGDSL
jgi:hypothetical protein